MFLKKGDTFKSRTEKKSTDSLKSNHQLDGFSWGHSMSHSLPIAAISGADGAGAAGLTRGTPGLPAPGRSSLSGFGPWKQQVVRPFFWRLFAQIDSGSERWGSHMGSCLRLNPSKMGSYPLCLPLKSTKQRHPQKKAHRTPFWYCGNRFGRRVDVGFNCFSSGEETLGSPIFLIFG